MEFAAEESQITRCKICGITRLEDAQLAIALGADALGFVFYEPSPRAVNAVVAADIIAQLPPFISLVGLFVNPDAAFVRDICEQVQLDLLQFHGDESPEFCEQFTTPYIKAMLVKADDLPFSRMAEYSSARGFLLDTYHPQLAGGTGETFNWDLIPEQLDVPIILAGGLTADNVAAAIQQVRPYAVDVSGGVEASKGIKSPEKMAAFLNAVRKSARIT